MTTKTGSSQDDLAAASIWIDTLNDSREDPARIMMFGLWLAKSPAHQSQIVAASEETQTPLSRPLRRLLKRVKGLQYSSAHGSDFHIYEHRQSHWPPAAAIGSATLAFFAILAVTLVWAQQLGSDRYATAVGGYEREVLPDGSVAELNTATVMQARVGKNGREISLLKGEALFKVAHDSSRPFIVRAGGTRVQAVGTEFSVRVSANGHVAIVVSEGRVIASHEAPGFGILPSGTGGGRSVSAGEMADDDTTRITVRSVTKDQIAARQAWRQGRLVFNGATLAELADEFNRYNSTQLVVADAAVASQKIGGQFDTTDVEVFVTSWEAQQGHRVERVRDTTNGRDVIRLFGR